jgi:His-Xaa-Ser system radical SAM maturase HxsB
MFSSPSPVLTMEFQGGESLLAFDLIKRMVPYAKTKAKHLNKDLELVITTNLSQMSGEILSYCKQEQIKISTSLDGPASVHNANRPRPGNDSHDLAIKNIRKCREMLGGENVAALMTTTQLSLQYPREIIDEYVRMDFHNIFLRPISPYGFALKTAHKTGYEMDEFLEFYKKGLNYIIELNRNGYELVEFYTAVLLRKILTPHGVGYVDLQSPAGAVFDVAVYNYDGDIYVSDESRMLAEMGDHSFRIGNVHTSTRSSLLKNDQFVGLLDAWCNEALPGCSDCALQTYCGADPIFHRATQGDSIGHRPTSGFCRRNKETIKHIIELLDKNDPHITALFWSWALDRSYTQMREELQ